MPTDTFSQQYLAEMRQILDNLNPARIDTFASGLRAVRDRSGRLFILGVGGSAASASHAACDFRKIANFEAYAPTDNIAELTARANDVSWDSIFRESLRVSRLCARDALLILSVSGGLYSPPRSINLIWAVNYAASVGATVFGLVGRDDGYTPRVADFCVVAPFVNPSRITPYTESLHSVLWHLLVNHPVLAL